MRVLITGAAGFIGRHIDKALSKAGHHVIGLDAVLAHPGYAAGWVTADITRPLPKFNLDAVIHLAAVANPRECDTDPTKAFNVNVNGTHQVLAMALMSGAKKVVFSSTAHVYGISPRYLPTDESHPLWLQNNYTLTKILGEQLCHLYYENHGLSYTALRLFNAYGLGQVRGYFIPDMIAKARTGGFELKGANTTKDFVWIDDVARAFVLALETPFVGAVNIGTGVETQLGAIARQVAEAEGVPCGLTNAPDATRMCAQYSRATKVLGWQPTKSVSEGLHVICDQAKAIAVR